MLTHTLRLRFLLAVGALLGALFSGSGALAGPAPVPPLPVTGTTVNGFEVSWDPDPASDDFFPAGKAIAAALSLDVAGPVNPPIGEPNGTHDGHARLGFLDPFFTDEWQVNFYDCTVGSDSCDNGWATNAQIAMPAPIYKDETDDCIRIILGHELFHHVEFAYQPSGGCGGTWGTTVCEGQARAMQDKIWSDADNDPSLTCKAPFLGDVKNYLGNPSQNLWQSSYRGALWWTYLMEQFGENDEEPTLGADFLVEWWDRAGSADPQGDEIQITQDTIDFFAPGRSIGSVFLDFAIANYANTLSFNGAPAGWRERWSYVDDTPAVDDDFGKPFVFSNTIAPGDPWVFNFLGIETVILAPWGIHYWEADTRSCPAGGVIRLNITHENAQFGRHAAIAVGDLVGGEHIKGLWHGTGSSFNIAFVQPGGTTNDVEKLVGVVAGTSAGAKYKFTFSCYAPAGPTNTFQATPEPFDPTSPHPILVTPAIVDPPIGPLPLTGIPPDQLDVFIGGVGLGTRAEIVSLTEIGGQYFARVLPGLLPVSPTGVHNVLIGLKGTPATVAGRVVSLPGMTSSGVFVFDVSGTIDAEEREAIQQGGSLLMNALRDVDQLGLVRFGEPGIAASDNSTLLLPVGPLTFLQRLDFDAHLSLLMPNLLGQSAIGDGLANAASQLTTAWGARYIVLVTDGHDPGPLTWEDVRSTAAALGIRIFTIGLGNDVDVELLQQIANETGGVFFLPEVDDEVVLGMQSAMLDIVERMTGKPSNTVARLAIESLELALERIELEPRSSEHRIVAYYDPDKVSAQWRQGDGTAFPAGVPGLVLRSGDGVLVAELDSDTIDAVALRLASTDPVGISNVEISYAALEAPGPIVDLHVAPVHPDPAALGVFLPDGEVGIAASFVDAGGPIDDVEARVFAVRAQGGMDSIVLFGDGVRGSRPPSGGVLGARYRRTGSHADDEPGFPGVTIYADLNYNGVDNLGRPFSGRTQRAFTVDPSRGSPDDDADELPDRYEEQHGCLVPDVDDASDDPDSDGLDTATERKLGTLPCVDDTDGGGENDGSEVRRGANPFDPDDDGVEKPGIAYVAALPFEHEDSLAQESGTTRHKMPGMAKFGNITLKRGVIRSELSPVASFNGADFPDGYPDSGLDNGRTYFYQMIVSGRNGEESAATPVYEGTPYASPFAPLGHVEINDGAPRTSGGTVTLHFTIENLDSSGAEMRFGSTPRLDAEPWMAFQFQLEVELGPGENQVYA